MEKKKFPATQWKFSVKNLMAAYSEFNVMLDVAHNFKKGQYLFK